MRVYVCCAPKPGGYRYQSIHDCLISQRAFAQASLGQPGLSLALSRSKSKLPPPGRARTCCIATVRHNLGADRPKAAVQRSCRHSLETLPSGPPSHAINYWSTQQTTRTHTHTHTTGGCLPARPPACTACLPLPARPPACLRPLRVGQTRLEYRHAGERMCEWAVCWVFVCCVLYVVCCTPYVVCCAERVLCMPCVFKKRTSTGFVRSLQLDKGKQMGCLPSCDGGCRCTQRLRRLEGELHLEATTPFTPFTDQPCCWDVHVFTRFGGHGLQQLDSPWSESPTVLNGDHASSASTPPVLPRL